MQFIKMSVNRTRDFRDFTATKALNLFGARAREECVGKYPHVKIARAIKRVGERRARGEQTSECVRARASAKRSH